MLERKQILRFLLWLIPALIVVFGARPWVAAPYAYLFRAGGNIAFSQFWFWSDGSVRFLDLRAPDIRRQIEDDFRSRVRGPLRERVYALLRQQYGFDGVPPGEAKRVFQEELDKTMTEVQRMLGGTRYWVEREKDTLMVLWNRSTPAAFGQLKTSSRLIGYTPTAVIIALLVATPLGWKRRGWGLLGGLVAIHLFILFRLTLTLAVKGFGAPKTYALFDLSGFWMRVLEPLEEIFVHKPNVAMVVAVFLWLFVALLAGAGSVFRSKGADVKPKRSSS